MKKGQIVLQKALIADGWNKKSVYGECEIWAKGNERLLWHTITHKIIFLYQGGI